MKNNNGFTILELLIAIAISAVVVLGGYSLLSSTVNTRTSLSNATINAKISSVLDKLISEDIESVSKRTINLTEDIDGNSVLKINTWHSLFFNSAIPVDVSYYIEDGYFVREEKRDDLNYDSKMKLIGNAKKFIVKSYNGLEFSKNFSTLKLLKIQLVIGKNTHTIITGILNE